MEEYRGCRKLWKKVMWLVGCGCISMLWGGCERNDGMEQSRVLASEQVVLSLENAEDIDSAQVYFFRILPGRDSLWSRQVVYGVTSTPKPYVFEMPAGEYNIFLVGNVDTGRVVSRAPYSSDSTYMDYQGISSIPALYLGRKRLNVGVDTVAVTGVTLLTAAVRLNIQRVPDGIRRLEVDLLNTSSGIFFNGMLREKMQPPVAAVLTGVAADSSYTIDLMSFPDYQENSLVEVRGYDGNGILRCQGQSVSFPSQMGRRRVVTCSFEAGVKPAFKSHKSPEIRLIWKEDEDAV